MCKFEYEWYTAFAGWQHFSRCKQKVKQITIQSSWHHSPRPKFWSRGQWPPWNGYIQYYFALDNTFFEAQLTRPRPGQMLETEANVSRPRPRPKFWVTVSAAGDVHNLQQQCPQNLTLTLWTWLAPLWTWLRLQPTLWKFWSRGQWP